MNDLDSNLMTISLFHHMSMTDEVTDIEMKMSEDFSSYIDNLHEKLLLPVQNKGLLSNRSIYNILKNPLDNTISKFNTDSCNLQLWLDEINIIYPEIMIKNSKYHKVNDLRLITSIMEKYGIDEFPEDFRIVIIGICVFIKGTPLGIVRLK